jgi:hypothetical protein
VEVGEGVFDGEGAAEGEGFAVLTVPTGALGLKSNFSFTHWLAKRSSVFFSSASIDRLQRDFT